MGGEIGVGQVVRYHIKKLLCTHKLPVFKVSTIKFSLYALLSIQTMSIQEKSALREGAINTPSGVGRGVKKGGDFTFQFFYLFIFRRGTGGTDQLIEMDQLVEMVKFFSLV